MQLANVVVEPQDVLNPLSDCVGCGVEGTVFVHGAGTLLGIHWKIWAAVVGASTAGAGAAGYLAAKKKRGRSALYSAAGGLVGSSLALAILGAMGD